MDLQFKDYLQLTRDQLEEALAKTPSQTQQYKVNRYCRLMIGETIGSKVAVQLKPKHVLEVKWLYENMDSPTPVFVRFSDVKHVDCDGEYGVYWTGDQLSDWLSRNSFKLK